MEKYKIGLEFDLPDPQAYAADYIESLCGCDDAMIGVGTRGKISFHFDREAESYLDAFISAWGDVQRNISGAKLLESSPSYARATTEASLRSAAKKQGKPY